MGSIMINFEGSKSRVYLRTAQHRIYIKTVIKNGKKVDFLILKIVGFLSLFGLKKAGRGQPVVSLKDQNPFLSRFDEKSCCISALKPVEILFNEQGSWAPPIGDRPLEGPEPPFIDHFSPLQADREAWQTFKIHTS